MRVQVELQNLIDRWGLPRWHRNFLGPKVKQSVLTIQKERQKKLREKGDERENG